MNCTGCGKDLPEGAKFCLECGAKCDTAQQESPRQENMILVCGSCGAIPEEGKKFCQKCGANLSESGVMKPAEQEASGTGQSMVLVCGSCGTKPEEGKKFCQKCGANISESGVMKPAEQEKASAGAPPASAASAMIPVTSTINHWSYEEPEFFDTMDLPFDDKEDLSIKGNYGPFSYEIARLESGGGINTLDDYFQNFQSAYSITNVYAKEKTEINGLPANYYQFLIGDIYTHLAVLAYKQETWGFMYSISINVPRIKMESHKEAMDAFILSFRLDEEKIGQKFSERGEARAHAETIWQKNQAARKNPEAENPSSFFFDGSFIRVTNSATKAELFIDNTLVAQWKSILGIAGQEPVLKAENYQFQSGPAAIAVYYNAGAISGEYNITVNMAGKIYALGRYKVNLLTGKLTRETT